MAAAISEAAMKQTVCLVCKLWAYCFAGRPLMPTRCRVSDSLHMKAGDGRAGDIRLHHEI